MSGVVISLNEYVAHRHVGSATKPLSGVDDKWEPTRKLIEETVLRSGYHADYAKEKASEIVYEAGCFYEELKTRAPNGKIDIVSAVFALTFIKTERLVNENK